MQVDDVSETVVDMRHEVVDGIVDRCIPEKAYPEEWNIDGLHEETLRLLNLDVPIKEWAAEEGIADEEIRTRIMDQSDKKAAAKLAQYGEEMWRVAEKSLLLQLLDQNWKDHLLSLDHLRQGIGLRAYGQRDPLNEYKRESFTMFEAMLDSLRERVTQLLAQIELRVDRPEGAALERVEPEARETRQDPAFARAAPPPEEEEALPPPLVMAGGGGAELAAAPGSAGSRTVRHAFDEHDPSTWSKVGRNAQCPCGSGKKYKHCHGKIA